MFDEEVAGKKKPVLKDLDPISIEELYDYIEELKAEIVRAEAEIVRKKAHMEVASSVFK